MNRNEYIKFLVKRMADPQKIDFLLKNAKDVRIKQGLPKNITIFNPSEDIFADVLAFAEKYNMIYVEGYIFQDKKMLECKKEEHAWVKLKNGKDHFDLHKKNAQNYISVIELEPNKVSEIKRKNAIASGGILSAVIAEYCLSVKQPRKS